MSYSLFSLAAPEQTAIPVGKLPLSIQAYQKDLQTGLVEVNFPHKTRHHLLFARGQLVNVYRSGKVTRRLNPVDWIGSMNGSSPSASLRPLALTPQAVRLIKILLEQRGDSRFAPQPELSLEAQIEVWKDHPVPALAHIHWPNAEALALLPGGGAPPRYTLFVAADQILHSGGGMMALYGWKETYSNAVLLSSEPRTPAWTEYLLHYLFSWLVSHLLERFEELTGRILLSNILRDINFTSAAHGWSIIIHPTSVTDQAVFSSPDDAAKVYSRLLQIIFNHVESVLGADLLNILLRESLLRLPKASRAVLKEYLLVTVEAG